MQRFAAALFSLLFICTIFSSCKRQQEDQLFSLLDAGSTGIEFNNTLFEDGPLNVANYIYFYNGGGVATGDINNDGLADVLFTGNMVRNRLYLNKGNFQFEDITEKAGVDKFQGWCTGASMADVNGDGLLDIYICRSADIKPEMRRNLLFINKGDGNFSEEASAYGLGDSGYSTQAAFFDYDKDGDLDCFLINHSLQKYTAGAQDNLALRNEHDADFACKLYQNNDMHFTDVSDSAGISSNVLTFGLGIAVSDFNNDGWPDLYVSNDFNEPDYYFVNQGNGHFTEQLSSAFDQASLYSMGSDAADYNNDGLVDLVTLDMLPESNHAIKMHSGPDNFTKFNYLFEKGYYYQYSRNMLQQNNGDGRFSEVGQLAGISNTDWSWSALLADYDNDGNKDLFVTNGYVKDYTEMDFLKYSVDRVVKTMHKDSVDGIPEYIRKMPSIRIPKYIFKNKGDGRFEKKTEEWGLGKKGVSAGAAYADLDNDGDLDLLVNVTNDVAEIYRNESNKVAPQNRFLDIELKGDGWNTKGIGTKAVAYSGDQVFLVEQFPVRGYESSSSQRLHLGLDSIVELDSLRIIWPDDRTQLILKPATNQLLTLDQKAATANWSYPQKNNSQAVFVQSTIPGTRQQEPHTNDFNTQPLLPNFLSHQGPAIATGDLNGDGLFDFFQGAPKGRAGHIMFQKKDGSFKESGNQVFAADANAEDVAAIFFDADQDGDLDLYVGSGGYDFNASDPLLQDRLYMNDGTGKFTKATTALPKMQASTGAVASADIDGDGDIDLFVGSRVIPGKYPLSPESFLLINDGKGNFSNETDTRAPMLKRPGMVTGVSFTDIDKNGSPDLILVGEWMPVQIFSNKGGRFTDLTEKWIDGDTNGWWNTLTVSDVDNDGDPDLILGNYGLNTQFQASPATPLEMYAGDFDGNGSIDPILCYYVDGKSYPAMSRDDLTEQLPGLKKKFLEYHEYADASIDDVLTPEQKQSALKLKASQLQTAYLENQNGKFVLHALPLEAQYAPVYGIAVADFNADGKKDLLLGGNNSWTRIKFGRYAANHGTLLLSTEPGHFRFDRQIRSGLSFTGNLRNMAALDSSGQRWLAGMNDADLIMIRLRQK